MGDAPAVSAVSQTPARSGMRVSTTRRCRTTERINREWATIDDTLPTAADRAMAVYACVARSTYSSDIPTEGTAASTLGQMAIVRLFAAARDAAGTGREELPGETVGDVLAAAVARYDEHFATVLANSRIWVNGEPADSGDPIGTADELAVLPPVSGG